MDNESLTIDPLTERELKIVVEIQKQAYLPTFHERIEVFAEKLNFFPAGCWMAYQAKKPVSYIFSHPWNLKKIVALDAPLGKLPDSPDCLYIHDLSVDPKYKGKGIGAQMIDLTKKLARDHQLNHLMLVSVQNSSEFWAKFGFEKIENQSDKMRNKLNSYGADACLMVAATQ